MKPALILSRFFSSCGEIAFRVVIANAAYKYTGSSVLVGLIVVAPNIAAAFARLGLSRLYNNTKDYGRLCYLVELSRMLFFLLFLIAGNYYAAIALLILTGMGQAVFEGAFGGAIANLHLPANTSRGLNAALRFSVISGGFVAASIVSFSELTLREAAIFSCVGYIVSSLCLSLAFHSKLSKVDRAPALNQAIDLRISFFREPIVLSYFVAAMALAIAAPSMVALANELIQFTPTVLRNSYALYQASIFMGAIIAGFSVHRIINDTSTNLKIYWLAQLIISTSVLLIFPNGYVLIFLTMLSAIAENYLVVELNSKAQRTLSPSGAARALFNLRISLGLLAFLGLMINLALSLFLAPLEIVGGSAFLLSIALWVVYFFERPKVGRAFHEQA